MASRERAGATRALLFQPGGATTGVATVPYALQDSLDNDDRVCVRVCLGLRSGRLVSLEMRQLW